MKRTEEGGVEERRMCVRAKSAVKTGVSSVITSRGKTGERSWHYRDGINSNRASVRSNRNQLQRAESLGRRSDGEKAGRGQRNVRPVGPGWHLREQMETIAYESFQVVLEQMTGISIESYPEYRGVRSSIRRAFIRFQLGAWRSPLFPSLRRIVFQCEPPPGKILRFSPPSRNPPPRDYSFHEEPVERGRISSRATSQWKRRDVAYSWIAECRWKSTENTGIISAIIELNCYNGLFPVDGFSYCYIIWEIRSYIRNMLQRL